MRKLTSLSAPLLFLLLGVSLPMSAAAAVVSEQTDSSTLANSHSGKYLVQQQIHSASDGTANILRIIVRVDFADHDVSVADCKTLDISFPTTDHKWNGNQHNINPSGQWNNVTVTADNDAKTCTFTSSNGNSPLVTLSNGNGYDMVFSSSASNGQNVTPYGAPLSSPPAGIGTYGSFSYAFPSAYSVTADSSISAAFYMLCTDTDCVAPALESTDTSSDASTTPTEDATSTPPTDTSDDTGTSTATSTDDGVTDTSTDTSGDTATSTPSEDATTTPSTTDSNDSTTATSTDETSSGSDSSAQNDATTTSSTSDETVTDTSTTDPVPTPTHHSHGSGSSHSTIALVPTLTIPTIPTTPIEPVVTPLNTPVPAPTPPQTPQASNLVEITPDTPVPSREPQVETPSNSADNSSQLASAYSGLGSGFYEWSVEQIQQGLALIQQFISSAVAFVSGHLSNIVAFYSP